MSTSNNVNTPKKPRTFKGKRYDSEIIVSENIYRDYQYTGNITELDGEETTYYTVYGSVFSLKSNAQIHFKKEFVQLPDAEEYFKDMIEEFPHAEIMILKQTRKELKIYI